MSQNQFDQLVALYRAINFKSDARQGTLIIADNEQRDLLVEILANGDEYGLKILQGNAAALYAGQTIELEISDPRIALGIFATDLNDLLDAPKARIREPARYFVAAGKFCKSDQSVPAAIASYRSLIKLISLLKEAAAYLDEEAGELVFIHDGKFELSIQYSASDVLKVDSESLSRLLESFEVDTHRDQKLAILAKSVQTVCNSAKPKERFRVLLEQISDLLKSFSEGYRLFVADFSYDKIVNQLEVAKLEEIGKIHKTFSDIQNQILGIPVATIVVATQMKAASTIGYEFWINTAVLVGCWVFVILSAFVLRNQLHTLTAIGDEVARKKKQMISDYKSIEDIITKCFPFLETRLKAQRIAFYAVGLILFVGFILAHVVYYWLTDPARAWLLSLFA